MIHVKLSAQDLLNAGACYDGIETFNDILPDGIDCEWTWLHSLWAAVLFGAHYHWCVIRHLIPALNLSCADLSYANLRFADLRSADLSCADLSYANLSFADLRSADLTDADLSYANLSYADLRSADLTDANITGAIGYTP